MLTLEDHVQLLRSTHQGARISKIHALNPRLVHTHWEDQKAKTPVDTQTDLCCIIL